MRGRGLRAYPQGWDAGPTLVPLCPPQIPPPSHTWSPSSLHDTQYVDIAIKVPERKYTAWPESIRTAFAPARTVKTGKPSFRLSLGEEASS